MTTDRDWDDEFANRAHVPGSDKLPAYWAEQAEAFRARSRCELDIPYGAAPREKLDLFLPDASPRGLVVIIHGGYWMMTSKSDWSHLAKGAVAQGFAVAMPSYTLAPDARISEITQQMSAALEMAANRVEGPIYLAGHSAGGHLVARLVSEDTQLSDEVLQRITTILPISGLFDLRPLMWAKLNDTLGLDEPEARAESPVLLRPKGKPRVKLWVGDAERPEFLRQSRAIAMLWDGLGAAISLVEDKGHNHFTIIEGLRDPDSPILKALLGEET